MYSYIYYIYYLQLITVLAIKSELEIGKFNPIKYPINIFACYTNVLSRKSLLLLFLKHQIAIINFTNSIILNFIILNNS